MCTSDALSSMTSAHPIPANSQSHSQRGFCVLLKSLKHLFPVYADTCKGTPKGTGLQSYRVPQTAFSIQVVETSHSPWTTCLLGQALPHSVFAASCSKLPAHKQHFYCYSIFRYYPEFLAGPLLADRQPHGFDASCRFWSFASAEKLAPILWIFFPLWITVSRLKWYQNLCRFLPPPVVQLFLLLWGTRQFC